MAGLRRPPLIAALALALSVACSTGSPAKEPIVSRQPPKAPEYTRVITASVLITDVPDSPAPTIDSIKVSPTVVVIDLGESVRLYAEAFGSAGQPLADVEFVWFAADPRAGSVTRDGRFQAGTNPGVYANSISVTGIQNTQEGIKYAGASANITVVGEARLSRLSSVLIIPGSPPLLRQQIHRMRAFGFDEDGVVIPGASFVWSLNNPTLGRLNDIGYLTVEGHEGPYRDAVSVTGIWDGVKVSATTDILVITTPKADDFLDVQVLPQRFFLDLGDHLQLRAVALNGLGELVAGTELRWSLVDSGAGTIDGRGNFIAGNTPGVYTNAVRVEALVPGESGFVRAEDFASVVVRRQEPRRIMSALSVVPQTVVLSPGGRATLVVRPTDETGETPKEFDISWTVLKPECGQVNETGVFTASDVPGICPDALQVTVAQHLDVEVAELSRTVNVIITGALTIVEVHPALAVVASGRTVHFSITGWDENNNILPGLVVIWKVTDESVGTIDAFGNLTAGQVPGLYQDAIRAEVIQQLLDRR